MKKKWCMWAPIGNFICEVVGEKLRKWERLGSSESVGMLWSLVVLCTLVVWWRLRGKLGRSREGGGKRPPQSRPGGRARRLGCWGQWHAVSGEMWRLWCIEMHSDGLGCFEVDWDGLRQWPRMQWGFLQPIDQVISTLDTSTHITTSWTLFKREKKQLISWL